RTLATVFAVVGTVVARGRVEGLSLGGGLLEDVVEDRHLALRGIRLADPPARRIRLRRVAGHHRVVGVVNTLVAVLSLPDRDWRSRREGVHHFNVELNLDLTTIKVERAGTGADDHSGWCRASKPVLVVIGRDVALLEPVQFEEAKFLAAAVVAGRC